MKPNRKTNTQSVGELTRQLSAQRTTRARFSVDMPHAELYSHLYASYAAEVGARGKQMAADEDTLRHIDAAARWLADPKGKVGLMLTGIYGNGKTTLMLAICRLVDWLYYSPSISERREFRIVKAKDIAQMAVDKERRVAYEALMSEELLAIDEVGEEPAEVISYGMPYTPLRDLFEERYARQNLTIIATNLVENKERGLKQITDHYGPRVVDRFREMMYKIPFTNPSYRKN